MPIGNKKWKSVGALAAFVLALMAAAGNTESSYAAVVPAEFTANREADAAQVDTSALATALADTAALADERKNETSLTNELYARAAVLMDAENGRILFSKNGDEVLPMASTTKIMTCILALETGSLEDVLPVSSYAARQPKVHMGVQKGEYYRMEDLLYGLMLESYNDAAVVLAEYYGSKEAGMEEDCSLHTEEESRKAVFAFTQKMNEKAKEIGCENTFFLTPNGLDAEIETGGVQKQHSCTAEELAAIMRYCVFLSPQKKTFLTITRTASRQFYSLKRAQDGTFETETRLVSAVNHNAFLQMMDGMLSGKTGFTGKAGYCYVGALAKGEKAFTIALLACGWPNNRTWKWHDAKLLLEYGLEEYDKKILPEPALPESLFVENGQLPAVSLKCPDKEIRLLLSRGDTAEVKVNLTEKLTAPVEKGEQVGTVSYLVNGAIYEQLPVTAAFEVPEITYCYCLKRLLALALL